MTAPLYLDDIQVGDRFTTGEHTLDEAQIVAFAQQFDPQPFHLDHEAAKDSLFGGLAASGWHTASISMRLMVTTGMRVQGGNVGAGCELQWPRPTRPGDVLHVETEVIDVRPSTTRPDRGIATLRSETKNQRGEVVQVLVSKMVMPRRPAQATTLR